MAKLVANASFLLFIFCTLLLAVVIGASAEKEKNEAGLKNNAAEEVRTNKREYFKNTIII